MTPDPDTDSNTDPNTDPNPYVGPRAFLPGEPLFGRDREARELLALLLAERIVLLQSPSGAGKTSLIQALLLAALRNEEIDVLPVIRVSAEPAPEDREAVRGANRYVLGALLSMDGQLPVVRQTPVAELARMSLDGYLSELTRRAGEPGTPARPQALIFDQFEEILHLDPTDVAAKEEFFDQAGAALRRDRDRWALFSMREDYVGALEPYVRRLPTRLRTTFRLDLLGEAAARQAIVEPARRHGVEFLAAAATALVDDLRSVWVQRPDGSRDEQLGPHIEPVQLQVVCHRLWSRLPPGAREVRPEGIEAAGDVDAALAGYYADRVAAIAAKTGVGERAIREWVEGQLITEQRTRGQVLFAPEESEGLKNSAIKELVDAHLVREERRRGFTWYELAHDRLIDPVRADNAEWTARSLSELQRLAGLWARQGRPAGLLLAGPGLREAEAWAGRHEAELTPAERDFLAACREARQQGEKELESRRTASELERQQRENRRFRAWLALTSALAILAVAALYVSQMARVAEKKARKDFEQKATELQKANDDLNQLVAQVYNRQALPQHERTAADQARQLIASGRTVAERQAILIQCFTKKRSAEVVNNLLKQGFRVRNLDSKFDATNAIWYGQGVQAEDLRIVALTLTEAGVKVQRIGSFQDPAAHQNVISVGTDTGSLTLPAMTVEQIKTLEVEKPVPGAPIPPAPEASPTPTPPAAN
jgi:hypothetical protein